MATTYKREVTSFDCTDPKEGLKAMIDKLKTEKGEDIGDTSVLILWFNSQFLPSGHHKAAFMSTHGDSTKFTTLSKILDILNTTKGELAPKKLALVKMILRVETDDDDEISEYFIILELNKPFIGGTQPREIVRWPAFPYEFCHEENGNAATAEKFFADIIYQLWQKPLTEENKIAERLYNTLWDVLKDGGYVKKILTLFEKPASISNRTRLRNQRIEEERRDKVYNNMGFAHKGWVVEVNSSSLTSMAGWYFPGSK